MTQPKYRMIAIDLDGTLLSPQGEVTERTREAVHRALAAGLLICFATGRNWTESRMVLETIQHYDTAVFAGGAMVIDTKNEVTLHRTMMDPQLAREVCRIIEDSGQAALVLQDRGTAGVDYLIHDDAPLNETTQRWLEVTSSTYHRIRVPELSQYEHDHTVRIGMVAAAQEVNRVQARLEEALEGRIFCHSIRLPTQEMEVLEVFDPSVNKWEGILHVARRHGIDPARIIAIGDDVNDLAMIQYAGLGVAMGNARDEVKALAKKIIGTNEQEGLAEFLDQLVAEHAVQPANETGR